MIVERCGPQPTGPIRRLSRLAGGPSRCLIDKRYTSKTWQAKAKNRVPENGPSQDYPNGTALHIPLRGKELHRRH